MRLKISIMAILLGALVLGTSCNKYLDEKPDNRTEIDSKDKIKKLLVNAYPEASPVYAHEMMTDNYADNGKQHQNYNALTEEYYTFKEEIGNISYDSPYYIWENCYNAIAHANLALEAIDELNDPDLEPQRGEALVCRAWSHFMLTNVFCNAYTSETAYGDMGIPYATEPETEVHVSYSRGTLEDTYLNILGDLEEGIALLNDGEYSQPKYHFTKSAASAFAATVCLYYSRQEDATLREEYLRKSIAYATEALGGNANNPETYRDMTFFGTATNTDEMTSQWVSSQVSSNLLLSAYRSLWGRYYYISVRYALNNDIKESDVFNSWGPWGREGLAVFSGCIYHVSYLNFFFGKCMEFFLYTNQSAGIGFVYAGQAPLSREKALLDRAEAYTLLGEYANAATDLNTWYNIYHKDPNKGTVNKSAQAIMDAYIPTSADFCTSEGNRRTIHAKYGLPNFDVNKTAMLHAVLHARRLETIHEGNRLMDLKRYALEYEHTIEGDAGYKINTPNPQPKPGDEAVAGAFPDYAPHDLRLTLQIPAMVLKKAPEWKNPRQ